jgi:hypothetical protein
MDPTANQDSSMPRDAGSELLLGMDAWLSLGVCWRSKRVAEPLACNMQGQAVQSQTPSPRPDTHQKVDEEAKDARRWCETINLKIMSVVLAARPDVGVALWSGLSWQAVSRRK